MKRIIFAAAGSAGHLEPALAVARWVREHHPEFTCEFVISEQGVENQLLAAESFTVHRITKAALPRKLNIDAILWPARFIAATMKVRRAVNGASVAIGFGGYICAPTYLMARMRKVPLVVHEANVLPGWANRLGMKLGAKGLIAFDDTRVMDTRFEGATTVGMPLRDSIYRAAELSPSARTTLRRNWLIAHGLNSEKSTMLVFGGSLGSQAINSVLVKALPDIQRAQINVIHVVGGRNALPAASEGYLPVNYLTDMADALISADLVISRSGAVTCSELAALGKFALLIPLEIGNGEQKYNASVLEKAGIAMSIANSAFTEHFLSANLIRLLKRAAEVEAETPDLSAIVHPHAVEAIGHSILSIASGR